MPGSRRRGVSVEDAQLMSRIDQVHARIERCLLRYMTKEETMHTLSVQLQIPPRFIKKVWEKLEEENQEFFIAYYRQLWVNNQILECDRLIALQVQHRQRLYHVSPTQQISRQLVENIRLPNGSLAQSSTQGINVDPSFMSQFGNMGLAETMNRNIVTTEADSSAQHLIGRLLDNDTSTVFFQMIKQCLRRYMTKEETMHTFSVRFQIPPRFTELVWRRLVEDNQDFFRAYYRQLWVNNQISECNRLIALQVEHKQRLCSYGSHVSPSQQISTASVENTRLPNGSSAQSSTQGINIDPSFMSQNGSSAQSSMQSINIDPSFISQNGSSAQSSTQRSNIDPSFMSQNGNMGLAESMNRNIVTTEASIENLPAPEPSNANSMWIPLGGDVERLALHLQSSSLQNPGSH